MTMEDFAAESGSGRTEPEAVTVASVLDRAIPIRWDEAVALLQDLLDIVMAESRDDMPGFGEVVIDPEGTVTVQRTRRGDRGPVAAGRALHTLLGTADVPLALRLFVTQANAPDTHASLQAFADGLAYFGKPGRSDLIRAIYERYTAAGAQAAQPATPRSLPTAPPASVTAHSARRPKARLPRWLPAALIGASLVIAVAVIWFGALRATGHKPDASAPAPQAANDKVEASRQKPASPHSNPIPARTAIARTSTADAGAVVPRTVKVGSIAAKTIATAPPRLEAPLFALEQPVQQPPSPFVFDPLPSSAVSPVDADASSRRVAAQEDPAAIYSFENGEVKPPVMLYPQLPPPLLIGSPAEALVNRMELVVAADGSVERVRLVNTPRRMADMMLLSGAKLWKFAPALKDGAPVRYRTIVSWTVFP